MPTDAAAPEELLTVVRVPLANLEADLRRKYRLTDPLYDVRIDADAVVFGFKRGGSGTPTTATESSNEAKSSTPRRRRKKAKRNRMKTRGWGIVTKMTNSAGQTAVIYKPFVDALTGQQLTPSKQRAAVAEILRSNGNDPNQASIDYYLQNTLEYLAQKVV